jgi:regulator of protease activity HflC (stomatin/prohibitin superfamily)
VPAPIPAVVIVIAVVVVIYAATSIRIVKEWEEVVVLTFGKYTAKRKPGLRFVWSAIQRGITIDKRVRTTQFQTSGTLSKDNVPVALLAVLFWQVVDVEKAALKVSDYRARSRGQRQGDRRVLSRAQRGNA